ncbi:MAG TPA: sulfotransferase [Rhodothermia bacterium]|nr:sulfotransferase [Rhodothermia bacterium]
MAETTKRKVLFILSPGYTGSTLLTLLMATHPDVATIGERRALSHRIKEVGNLKNRCMCRQVVPECAYVSAAYEAGRRALPFYLRGVSYTRFKMSNNPRLNHIAFRLAQVTDFGQGRDMMTRWVSSPYRRVCAANVALMDFVMEAEGARVFLDASKNPSDVRHMKASGLFDVTVIDLSRDGRGRFYSLLNRHPWLTIEEAAQSVRQLHERQKEFLAEWEGPVIHVRYEELCRRPLDELRRIAVEAELDPNGMSLDFPRSCEHCIGNENVVHAKSKEIRNQELWRTNLAAEMLAVFERIAGESNRSFGYTD